MDNDFVDPNPDAPFSKPLPDNFKVNPATGAIRSRDADHVRFDLISPIALQKLAETYAEGAAKYGDHNWRRGFPFSDTINHVLQHINLWLMGDRSEPHLAHAAWGLFTLMEFEDTRPELDDIFFHQRGGRCNTST